MACALTQGFTLNDCRDNMGGDSEFHIIEHGNIEAYTVAAGVVTALTKATGKAFFKYQQEKGTSEVDETISVNVENGTVFIAPSIKLVLNKRQASVRNEIMLLARNLVVIVEKDRNGKYWIHGLEFGLRLDTSNAKSGRAASDRNGYELNFTGEERELAYELQGSIAADLQEAGA